MSPKLSYLSGCFARACLVAVVAACAGTDRQRGFEGSPQDAALRDHSFEQGAALPDRGLESDARREDASTPVPRNDAGAGEDGAPADGAGAPDGSTPPQRGSPGDRRTITRRVYPRAAFAHEGLGGRVLDVTRLTEVPDVRTFVANPSNARPDDGRDDTKALIDAYSYVAEQIRRDGILDPNNRFTIYLPRGTYDVSDTIIYRGETLDFNPRPAYVGDLEQVRFIGESRADTVIRLRDGSPGFAQPGAPKPILSFARPEVHGNNIETRNVLRGLTIDAGANNPGAAGVVFAGANANEVSELTLRAGAGSGAIGLHLRVGATEAYFFDLTIEGFAHGISVEPYNEIHIAFEHLTLRRQRSAAIRLVKSTSSFRNVASQNSVPALHLVEDGAHAVIVESSLRGGSPAAAAIELAKGQLFAREIEVEGYGHSLRQAGKPVAGQPAGRIGEYVSARAFSVFAKGPALTSIPLPVEEVPHVPWFPPEDWANVSAFREPSDPPGDDGPAAQRAIASGAKVVYFPRAVYTIRRQLIVPASVRRINAMYGRVNAPAFVVTGSASEEPVLFEDGYIDAEIIQRGTRTLVINHVALARYRNEDESGRPKVFFQNTSSMGQHFVVKRAQAWMRMANNEPKHKDTARSYGETEMTDSLSCDGASMWVFGYRTENNGASFRALNGCKLEVLGGSTSQHTFYRMPVTTPTSPIIRVYDRGPPFSQVSATLATSGKCNPGAGYELAVRNTRGTEKREIPFSELPPRPTCAHQAVIPLYVDR